MNNPRVLNYIRTNKSKRFTIENKVGNRIYQELNPDASWNSVNGYYGLAKDAYPAVSEAAAEKAVNEWNLRNAVNNTLSWRRVKWIPELGQFLAVPNNSTTLQISNNGINWTPVTAGFSYAYRQIAWSKELNRVVVGNTGNPAVNRLAYSDDLINWNYTDISNNRFESVVWASEIGLFVASSSLDTLLPFNRILTSPDGITWTKQTSVDDSEPWRPLCWSAELGILVNLVNKANLTVTSKLQISKDGINWTEYPLLTEGNWTDMVWSKELGIFVVVSDTFLGSVGNQPSKIITSPDGINWTERINPDTTIDWFGIEWSPELGLFVVVGSKTGGSTMMASSNGIDWKIYTNFDSTKAWASISWSAELGIFVACALSGTGERLITSSLKGRPPTSYNVFDSSFNNIDSSGNWTLKVKELNGNVEISGNLSLNCNLINDVSGIYFCDGTYIGSGNSFDISTNEVLKIYSNNGISQIINTAGDTLLLDGATRSDLTERGEKLQIHSLSAAGSAAGFYCYDAATSNSTRLEFYKNESGNITDNGVVSSNSTLGFIGFQGWSGTQYTRGASITAVTERNNVGTGLRFATRTAGIPVERMRIDSSGNVGIGTVANNTYQGLTIFGSDPSLRIKGSGPSSWTWLEFVTSTNINNYSFGVNQTNAYFGLKVGAGMDGLNLYIDTSANVGIGTSASTQKPQARLDVTDDTSGNVLFVKNIRPLDAVGDVSNSYPVAFFAVKQEPSTFRGLEIGAPAGNVTGPVYLKVKGTSNRMGFFNESDVENMTLLTGGNVGIGTINPTNKLVIQNGNYSMTDTGYVIGTTTNNFGMIMEVSGNVGNSAALWIKNDTPSAPVSTLLRVENNGNVGIGTAPTARLDVNGVYNLRGGSEVGGVRFIGRTGMSEYFQLTQGKFLFNFNTFDFYGSIYIKAYGTNYNRGTQQERIGKWVISLRYQNNRTLNSIYTYGIVNTSTYGTGLSIIWTNTSTTQGELRIYNENSADPDTELAIELEYFRQGGQTLVGKITRTAHTNTEYNFPSNPYP
jgi:hypothetical protein